MSLSLCDLHPVILAGGLGTRLRRVLEGRPKPLVEADGRPVLEWIVRYLGRFGFTSVSVSTGYLGAMIQGHFQANPVPGIDIQCVAEDRPLGTAGGFLNVARQSGRTPRGWLVLNGDSLVFADLHALTPPADRAGFEAAILARAVEDASRFGTLSVAADGRLTEFAEKAAAPPGPGLVNTGVYLLKSECVDRFPAREPLSFEYDVFPTLLSQGVGIAVEETNAPFLDIGTEATLALADEFIRRNRDRFS